MIRAIALASLLAAPSALAGARISVLPFKGTKANSSRAQIYFPLCEKAECVAVDKASSKGRPDLAKARKNRIDGLLVGTVVKAKKKLTLELKLVGPRGESLLKKSYALLPNGKLAPKQVSQAISGVLGAAGGGAGEEESAPAAVAERESAPADEAPSRATEAVAAAEPAAEEPAPSEVPETRSRRRERATEEESTSASEVSTHVESRTDKSFRESFVSVQVGSELFTPSLRFAGVTTTNLRNYSSPLVVAPRFRLEAYPLGLFMKGIVTGVGVEADYLFSVASRTKRPNDGVIFGTRNSQLDIAARFRIAPIKGSHFSVTPFAGFRMQDFAVGAGSDGSKLDGLPNISYRSLRAGLDLNVPLLDVLSLSAAGAYLKPLSTGEIGKDFFPGTVANGFEVGGGVNYAIGAGFDARALVHFQRHTLKFKVTEGATYSATDLVDQQFGGTVALRYTY